MLADGASSQPSGPTDAFRSFLLDIQQGNSADIATLCLARSPDSQSLLRDFQDMASAMAYLRTAVTKKFGADAVDSVLPELPTLGELDDVTETITGDRADLTGATIWPMRLRNVKGKWKLDLDWLARSEDMPQNPRWFAAMAQAIRRTADDIAGGRLTTPGAAIEVIHARQQAIPDTTPSQPTTQP